LANEIKVSANKIAADDVVVQATGKKILLDLENTPISVEPAAKKVVIKEKLDINADEVSIENNILKVGNSEVKLLASDVADKLGVSPVAVELKEENSKAVYAMETKEKRKLFGFIPVNVSKTVTADAVSGDFLTEHLPWYTFFMTK
jgi:hypothetical protein